MKRLLLAALAGGLIACAPLPPAPDDPAAVSAYQAREAQLAQLDQWFLSARLSLSSEAEAWNASLRWRQEAEDFHINVIGPFGQGGLRLAGDSQGVVMQTADNEVFAARDAESLLYGQTGVQMPVSGLRYWVRGLPDPVSPFAPQLDHEGRLTMLTQGGWQVRFRRYTQVRGLELPDRIFLSNADYEIRLAIDRWDLAGRIVP